MNNLSVAEASRNVTSFDRDQSHQTDGLSSSTAGTGLTNGVSHRSTCDLDDDNGHSGTGDDEANTEILDYDKEFDLSTHGDTASQDGAERVSRSTDNFRPVAHSRDNSDGDSMLPPLSPQSSSYQHPAALPGRGRQVYNVATCLVPREVRVTAEGALKEATMTAIGAAHTVVGSLPGSLGSMGQSMVNMTAGRIVGQQLAIGGFLRRGSLGWGAETRGTPEEYARRYDYSRNRNHS